MLTLPAIVFGALAAAVVAPWTLGRLNPRLLVLVPLAALGALIYITGEVTSADLITHQISWVGSLGVNLSFRIDAFSLLFCWLITGIGALVVFYSASYFSDNPRVKYFTFLILSFMAAMIGAVLSDDVIIFFIFWELTSVISFLLIGFDSTKPEARRAATQSLMITAGGGLALLAGLLLLAQAAGSTQFTVIVGEGARIAERPIYPFALILILAGACTKSAQLPFQFWLANAMAAPTLPIKSAVASSSIESHSAPPMTDQGPTMKPAVWPSPNIVIATVAPAPTTTNAVLSAMASIMGCAARHFERVRIIESA